MAGYFTGIKVPLEIAQHTRDSMPVAETEDRIDWTIPEQMHSTLQYYGGVPWDEAGQPIYTHEEYRARIIEEWSERVKVARPFSLIMCRTYWHREYFCADLAGGLEEWHKLASGTAPHVTLGRAHNNSLPGSERAARVLKRHFKSIWVSRGFTVSEVYLFHSRNRKFEVLHRFDLEG